MHIKLHGHPLIEEEEEHRNSREGKMLSIFLFFHSLFVDQIALRTRTFYIVLHAYNGVYNNFRVDSVFFSPALFFYFIRCPCDFFVFIKISVVVVAIRETI